MNVLRSKEGTARWYDALAYAAFMALPLHTAASRAVLPYAGRWAYRNR